VTEVAEPPGLLDATGEIAVGLLPNHECLIESHPPDIPLRRFTEQAGIGYLTGKVTFARGFDPNTDLRSGFDRFSPDNLTANRPILEFLERFSEKKNATPAQIALAWLLAQKPWIVPIPGTRNLDHLHENLQAIHVQLTPADLGEIESALSNITVHGGRINAEQMRVVDQAK
jgi:Aldo/keto reductase family